MMSLLALALMAAGPSDRARIFDFDTRTDTSEPIKQICTGHPMWCIAVRTPDDGAQAMLDITRAAAASDAPPTLSVPLADPDGGAQFGIWPNIVELPDGGILVGIERTVTAGYSGGGGSGTELLLFRLNAGPAPLTAPQVLVAPLRGSVLIRACFSEKDMRDRHEACHDEYTLESTLTLDETTAAQPMPRLVLDTQATTFPAGVSRETDNTRPLRKADLVKTRDPKCSFRRSFDYDRTTGEYAPDTPLPDCSQYTVP